MSSSHSSIKYVKTGLSPSNPLDWWIRPFREDPGKFGMTINLPFRPVLNEFWVQFEKSVYLVETHKKFDSQDPPNTDLSKNSANIDYLVFFSKKGYGH
ncbi:hypothetical protein BpHYR1_008518 [Brachionus plicatilis]|uniref:Uncharacterized protein n=1 Tax=Brachionus plicatilis TaxID=10195 RepID=A0A3M7T4X3_BRAPC|nr:hypothetical protein BpHYR1_008518 [Brachionus plicatilis]